MLLPAVPIVYLFVLRMLGGTQARRPGSAAAAASQPRAGHPLRTGAYPRQGVARGAAALAEEQA